MNSRKINMLFLLGLGFYTFAGFKTLAVVPNNEISKNKDTLSNLVTVNENAPVSIKWGSENPIDQIMSVIDQDFKEEYETLKFAGITELHKQKYVSKNAEVLLTNYNKSDYSLNEVLVEVRSKTALETTDTVKNYRVLVKMQDANAPEITLRRQNVSVSVGKKYDAKSNIKSITDVEDGNISNYRIEGKVDTNKPGVYDLTVIAQDYAKNETKKSFKVTVKGTARFSSGSSAVANYSYLVSDPHFVAPNLSYRAALNGAVPGNCTWYVYNRLAQLGAPIPHRKMGNGGEWAYYARKYGYEVSNVARAGSVWTTQNTRLGHVAFVEKVNADGSIVVSEMNTNGLYSFRIKTYSAQQAKSGKYINFGLSR